MRAAPKFVFIYTVAGIAGSVLALLQITILLAVFVTQGLKARSLQRLCPIAVHFQYYSGFLQLLSMFNHIGYITQFYNRLTDAYPSDHSYMNVIMLSEAVLGAVLPFIMTFTIYQTKQMCYSNLKKMIAAAVIQKHIYLAIGTCQVLSSLLVMGICGINALTMVEEVEHTDAVVSGNTLATYIVSWTYFVFPAMGILGLFLGLFYVYVTSQMNTYELDCLGIEETKEASMLAGQRVSLEKGSHCIVRHVVEKPSLNGCRGTIEVTGTDDQGRVAVNVDGREYKLEEFQCEVTTPLAELEEVKLRAKLKTAELMYKFDQKGQNLKMKQIFYVTSGQVICGLLVYFILLPLTQARMNAINVFHELYNTVVNFEQMTGEFSNASSAQIAQSQTQVLHIQGSLCSLWVQCIQDAPSSLLCGSCVVPKPINVEVSALTRPTFLGDSIFGGASFVTIVASAGLAGAIGFLFSCCFLCGVAGLRFCGTLITMIPVIILFVILGVAAAPLPHSLTPYLPIPADRCGALDLDPDLSGIQGVPTECLKIIAAHHSYDLFEMDAKLSVMGTLINMFFYLFESLFNLARAIQATGPTLWAKFEVQVFLYYFLLVACVLQVANIFADMTYDGQTTYIDWFFNIFHTKTQFAAEMSRLYNEQFPLYYNKQWELFRQQMIGKTFWCAARSPCLPCHDDAPTRPCIWYTHCTFRDPFPSLPDRYNQILTVPTLSIIGIVQLSGIISGCFKEIVWVRVMRFVIIFDLVICMTLYASMGYLSFISINLGQNLVTALLIPLCVQLLFAVFYAIQSDMLPVYDYLPSNPVLRLCTAFCYVIPVLLGITFSLGLSYFLFYGSESLAIDLLALIPDTHRPVIPADARTTGAFLMIASGVGIAVMLLSIFAFVAKSACMYYSDSAQMAADWLSITYPKLFGVPGEDDQANRGDEEDLKALSELESATGDGGDDGDDVDDESAEKI